MYDGTLVFDESTGSKSILGRISRALGGGDKETNYLKLDKTGEMEKGMLAMLPDWSIDLLLGHTVYDLLDRIHMVTHRQQFLAQNYIWPDNKPKGTGEVNQVCDVDMFYTLDLSYGLTMNVILDTMHIPVVHQ